MSFRRYRDKTERLLIKKNGYRGQRFIDLLELPVDYYSYYTRAFQRWHSFIAHRLTTIAGDICLALAIGCLTALSAWCFVLVLRGA